MEGLKDNEAPLEEVKALHVEYLDECDDLVGIDDPSCISNEGAVDRAIETFRKIMSKKHEPKEKDGQMVYPIFANPLLPGKVPEELECEKLINSAETIYAVFYKMVDDALKPYL